MITDAALALELIGHNLSLRRQPKPPSSAVVPFGALIDVSPPFGHQCSWVFEHGSWQRFGETWPTGLPRLMTVDDLSAHATDDDEEEEDDVPVVSDEEEGSATRLDDGSESTTDHDDDDGEDDVPVVSDDDHVEEVWEDDF